MAAKPASCAKRQNRRISIWVKIVSNFNSMGAPIGNHNGRGKKGRSGRKSAFQELSDARRLKEQWVNPEALQEAKERVRVGRGSLEDIFLTIAGDGSVPALGKIFDRLYPTTNLLGPFPDDLMLTDEQREEIEGIFAENTPR